MKTTTTLAAGLAALALALTGCATTSTTTPNADAAETYAALDGTFPVMFRNPDGTVGMVNADIRPTATEYQVLTDVTLPPEVDGKWTTNAFSWHAPLDPVVPEDAEVLTEYEVVYAPDGSDEFWQVPVEDIETYDLRVTDTLVQ